MSRATFWFSFALVVFVMITASLGVTFFVFYQKCAEAQMQQQHISDSLAIKSGELAVKQSEREELKKLIGAAPELDVPAIVKQHDDLMQKYAENFNKNTQVYSSVLAYLYNQIQVQNFTLGANQQDIKDLTAFNENRAKFNAVATDSADKIRVVIAQDKDDYSKALQTILASLASQKADLDKLAKVAGTTNTKAIADINARIEKTTEEIKAKIKVNRTLRSQMTKTEVKLAERPDGIIQFVSAASGKATINLGSADHLNLRSSFTVYPSTETDLKNGIKKANIEVVEVTGLHSAECRILSDDPSDPIIPGDKIYSPVWDSGVAEHYAIAGFIDLDGDGQNDVRRLVRIIEANGGVVDGYQDGEKQVKRLESTTNTLVLGRKPDEKTKETELLTYQNFFNAAKEFKTKTMNVQDLLDKMGVDASRTNVIKGDSDTRPEPMNSSNFSGGSVSGIFMEE